MANRIAEQKANFSPKLKNDSGRKIYKVAYFCTELQKDSTRGNKSLLNKFIRFRPRLHEAAYWEFLD